MRGIATLIGFVALFTIISAVITATVWPLPIMLTSQQTQYLSPAELLKAQNDVRTTLAGMVAGVAALIGIGVGLRSYYLARSGQYTDRYKSSVELLTSQAGGSRIGAVYALDRLGKDSSFDRRAVIEVLAAFIRSGKPEVGDEEDRTVPPDVQAALNVLAKRWAANYLRYANLSLAVLCRAEMRDIKLREVVLRRADLSFADLRGCDLRGADLAGADLKGASLADVKLANSVLTDADMRGIDLSEVKLSSEQLQVIRR